MDTNWCAICGKQTVDGKLYCSEACRHSDTDSIPSIEIQLPSTAVVNPSTVAQLDDSVASSLSSSSSATTTTVVTITFQQAPLSSPSTSKPKDSYPFNSHHFLHHLDHDESTDDLALEYEQLKRDQQQQQQQQQLLQEENTITTTMDNDKELHNQEGQEQQREQELVEQSQNIHLKRLILKTPLPSSSSSSSSSSSYPITPSSSFSSSSSSFKPSSSASPSKSISKDSTTTTSSSSSSHDLIIEEGTSLSFRSAHQLSLNSHFHPIFNSTQHSRRPYQRQISNSNNNNNCNNLHGFHHQSQHQPTPRLLHPLMKWDSLVEHQRRTALKQQQQQIQLQLQQQQYQQQQFLKNHSFNSLLTA